MKQVKWFDRKFNFDSSQNIFPSIIERLAGTPVRMEEKFKTIPSAILTHRINNTWTIKENTGHLIDLESVWQGRFQDIVDRKKELRTTDLQNNKTNLANHNKKPINDLLQSFRLVREQTIAMLSEIDEEIIYRSSLHPRLKTPMSTMDLFLFVADHDDHHLARITELVRIIGVSGI
jgi:uncharacterized damage-inducible protein DinB